MSSSALAILPAHRGMPTARVPFHQALEGAGLAGLRAVGIDTLQVNVGKKCNQSCAHCHVDAGPDRTEVMPDSVVDAILEVLSRTDIGTLDITGGAPELHPRFRDLLAGASSLGRTVLHRCNLTVLCTPKYASLIPFLAQHRAELVCSLPSLSARQTDAQRGAGVFAKSLEGLRMLNEAGFGSGDLKLHLVTNPTGAFLPGDQQDLADLWHRDLKRRHGIVFDDLYTITNMPIARYLDFLRENGHEQAYMDRLESGFNGAAAQAVMCRSLLSVAWDGSLHDCDFNNVLELGLEPELPRSIFEYEHALLTQRPIKLGDHCYGCTAGAGSSCGGAVA